MVLEKLDPFTRSFLETALWAETDDGGDPLDDNYGIENFDPATLERLCADCQRFQEENAATRFGRVDLYVGDDGNIYAD